MYFNVLTFKNGKNLAFTTEVPFSADKTSSEWVIITDAKTGQTITFKGPEVVAILSSKVDAKKDGKKANFKTEVVSE